MKNKTLGQLAELVGGQVAGDPETKINAVATLEKAGNGDISFLTNQKYTNQLKTTKASAIIVAKDFKLNAKRYTLNADLLIADDPYYALSQIVVCLHGYREHPKTGISKNASIAKTATVPENCHIADCVTISENVSLGDRCFLYPNVFVGPNTKIGNDCILYPNAVIYDNCRLGNRVIIQANTTVGEDGFGFATYKGKHHKIPHIGSVIIEDDAEIGSGCGIERGTLDDTVIGTGAKIGDLVAIGHGTKIGPHCLLVAQVGISGSTTLGSYCVVGGQAGIAGHINIGNGVMIGAQSGVSNSIDSGKTVLGAPAVDAGRTRRTYVLLPRLPEMHKSIKRIQKRLDQLEKSEKS